ncbi:hypothetical protein [Candidatus Nitrosotenuis cloacae]|jgi:hypothetical protein|uniref:hypothetical protein n=1 Tax=Candidatus Nitrosotenuis cloacae TaxID=1603555 RepID=UPI002281CCCE|nr:hypothetical protein [Candidatus Nitrosotenuis cloacae]
MIEGRSIKKARSQFKTSPEYKELIKETNAFKRRTLFLGFLTKILKQNGVEAVLVGGQAIDLYTAGTFATTDIDLVVDNKIMAEKLLNRFGFGKEANGLWLNKDLVIVIQIISQSYSGDSNKIRKFKVRDYEIKVAAPEDLIQNRLYSAKFWKSNTQRDMEESVALLGIFADSIDNSYLDRLAKENDIEDYLAKARQYTSEVI